MLAVGRSLPSLSFPFASPRSELRACHHLAALDAALVNMLKTEAWHHPLFFRYGRWNYDGISAALWETEAKRVTATLQEDGGVCIERYAELPWWRPVWTVDLFVALKRTGLLGDVASHGGRS